MDSLLQPSPNPVCCRQRMGSLPQPSPNPVCCRQRMGSLLQLSPNPVRRRQRMDSPPQPSPSVPAAPAWPNLALPCRRPGPLAYRVLFLECPGLCLALLG